MHTKLIPTTFPVSVSYRTPPPRVVVSVFIGWYCSVFIILNEKKLESYHKRHFWKKQIGVLSIIPNSMYGRFHSNPGETPPVSLNRKPYLNRHTLHNTKKQRHHDLPCPPASSGFKFKGKCDRHTSRDCALPAQHRNAFFKCLTNYSLRRPNPSEN